MIEILLVIGLSLTVAGVLFQTTSQSSRASELDRREAALNRREHEIERREAGIGR